MIALQYLDFLVAGMAIAFLLLFWRRTGSLPRALFYSVSILGGLAALTLLGFAVYRGDVAVATLGFDQRPVTQEDGIQIVYSSPDDPYLERLRDVHDLDGLIAGTSTDLDRILAVSTWVNALWQHDGDNQPSSSDPLTIIAEAKQGNRFRCVEYAIVLDGALKALGIPARRLGLKTADVETRTSGAGHVVVEAYSRDLQKWLLVDPQFNLIPMVDGVPLNALELQRALASEKRVSYKSVSRRRPVAHLLLTRLIYPAFIGQYLHFFDFPMDQSSQGPSQHLMLVPKGAAPPRVFQGRFPLDYMVYTHNQRLFYAAPQSD